MPKEKINYAQVHKIQVPTTESGENPPSSGQSYGQMDTELSVLWHNSGGDDSGGHVQFAAGVDISYLKALIADSGDATRVELWLPLMDRREINRAIRILRSARDKALGADA